jgi:uncharacterized protein YdhG (YjbR/CyaY superfamily)
MATRKTRSRASTRRTPAGIDAYLATLDDERRATLAKLRATIHAVVPRAEECISYGMPAFRVDGAVVAGFLATARGCSYFPFSGSTLETLADELARYDRTKSGLHFPADRPLPSTLVRKLLRARLAEVRSGPAPRRPRRYSRTGPPREA